MKRVLIGILVIALMGAGVAGVIWFRNRNAAQVPQQDILRVAEVIRGDLAITVASSGSVAVQRKVDLTFETPGTVRSVSVAVGDRIKAGQELARLDDTSLLDSVRRAELELAQAQLNLDILRQPVDETEIALAERAIQEAALAMTVASRSEELAKARAAQDQIRVQRLEEDTREAYESYLETLDRYGMPQAYAAGITAAYMEAQGTADSTAVKNEYAIQQARSQWFSAYERYESAQQQVEALKAGADEDQIRNLELQVEQVKLSLEQAQADLDSVILVAPFDGIISAVNVRVNTAAPTALPAFTLIDDARLFIDLNVDEIDIGALAEGQPAVITLDAYVDTPLTGVVNRISVLPSNLGGIIVYSVRILITDTTDTEPRDGMTASTIITTGQHEDVLLIPNWAVRTNQSSDEIYTYCYCSESSQLQQVPIEVGARNETWTEVTAGLEEGMSVALVTETQNLLEFQGPPSEGRP